MSTLTFDCVLQNVPPSFQGKAREFIPTVIEELAITTQDQIDQDILGIHMLLSLLMLENYIKIGRDDDITNDVLAISYRFCQCTEVPAIWRCAKSIINRDTVVEIHNNSTREQSVVRKHRKVGCFSFSTKE